MGKVVWKAGTMLAPLPPALVSCGTVDDPKVLTIAWTGIIASEPPLTYISVRPGRHSHAIIKESGEFVINLPNLALLVAADYCGVKSGASVDKFKEMALTPLPCSKIGAPQIAQAPVSLECKVLRVETFGTHDMFLAEILAVNIDDQYLDKDGKLCLEKAGLIAFAHGEYFTFGRKVGTFGFSVNRARLREMEKQQKVEVEVLPKRKAEAEGESDNKRERAAESKPRKPFGHNPFHTHGQGNRKPFGKKPFGGNPSRPPLEKGRRDRDEKPFGKREDRPFERREGGGGKPFDRKPFGGKPGFKKDDRKPFERRDGKPFEKREGRPEFRRDDRKPFERREGGGKPRFEGEKDGSPRRSAPRNDNRKPFGDKPEFKRDDRNPSRPPLGKGRRDEGGKPDFQKRPRKPFGFKKPGGKPSGKPGGFKKG